MRSALRSEFPVFEYCTRRPAVTSTKTFSERSGVSERTTGSFEGSADAPIPFSLTRGSAVVPPYAPKLSRAVLRLCCCDRRKASAEELTVWSLECLIAWGNAWNNGGASQFSFGFAKGSRPDCPGGFVARRLSLEPGLPFRSNL